MDEADKLSEIRQRASHTNDQWNVLWAKDDRDWLLKRIDELEARNKVLEEESAAYDTMAANIMASEDKRILAALSWPLDASDPRE